MVKLIVTGDVSRLDLLHEKVEKLSSSALGPFDVVLVSNLLDVARLAEYASGARIFPVSMYFLAADESAVPPELHSATEAATRSRIQCLREAGHQNIAGLRVAYAHVGHHDAKEPISPGLMTHLVETKRDRPHGRDTVFDVLLTNLAPAQGLDLSPAAAAAAPAAIRRLPDALTSATAASIAAAAEPRYHFCPGPVYYQRAPYSNPSGLATRLIAVAPYDGVSDGKGEQKNLHALNLTPSPAVDLKTLTDTPEGATPSPYEAAAAGPAAAGGFAGAGAPAPAGVRPSAGGASSAAARAALGALAGRSSGSAMARIAVGEGSSGGSAEHAAAGEGAPGGPPAAKRPRTDDTGHAGAGAMAGGPGGLGAGIGGLTPAQVAALQAEGSYGAGAGGHGGGLPSQQQQYFWNVRGGRRGGGRGGAGGLLGSGPQGRGYEDRRGGDGSRPHYITHGQQRQPRPSGAPPECWFCLASPQVEKHLIVAIGAESYVALPKGGVAPSHALIIPISHHVSLAAAPASLRAEVARFAAALAALYATQGLRPVLFERVLQARRGETPVHTHLQVIGVPADAAARAEGVFTTEGAFKQVPFETLPPAAAPGLLDILPQVAAVAGDITAVSAPNPDASSAAAAAAAAAGTGDAEAPPPSVVEYLYVEVPAAASSAGAATSDTAAEGAAAAGASSDASELGSAAAGDASAASAAAAAAPAPVARLLHRVPPGVKHPVQFGREVLCRLLNCPERLSWKTCAAGVEAETAATEAFRKAFAPFDFTADM